MSFKTIVMNDEKTTLSELKEIMKNFRDDRDWQKFHDPKNLAEALTIEASELLEHFLWKTKEEIQEKLQEDDEYAQEIRDELSDVLAYVLNMANALEIDLAKALQAKLEKSAKKYPVEKAKGVATKYNKL